VPSALALRADPVVLLDGFGYGHGAQPIRAYVAPLGLTYVRESFNFRFMEPFKHAEMVEMALTLEPEESGLPFTISLSQAKYVSGMQRPPRFHVYEGRSVSSVAIEQPMVVLAGPPIGGKLWEKLRAYVNQNRQLMLQLWRGEITQSAYLTAQHRID
jgi:hypothetical protein